MKTAFALFALSLVLLGLSMPMDPFTPNADGSYPFHSVAHGDDQAYRAARDLALTPKYRLRDYGGTLLALGLIAAVLSRRPLTAPGSGMCFVAIAIAAPTLTSLGFVFDLMQGQSRQEFPPWSDSLGIPLSGVPVLLILGAVWAFAHLALLAGATRLNGDVISLPGLRRGNRWLRVVCGLTVLFGIGMGICGAYWYAIPGALWLYFYASISSALGPHAAEDLR